METNREEESETRGRQKANKREEGKQAEEENEEEKNEVEEEDAGTGQIFECLKTFS